MRVLATTLLAAALCSAALAAPALAQDVGNPTRGKALAEQMCGDCHEVGPKDKEGGKATAPSFHQVANTSGMTGMAISAWFYSEHPSMPNLIIKPDKSDDIIAYILTLREPKEAKPKSTP